jgi:hypothetical protein
MRLSLNLQVLTSVSSQLSLQEPIHILSTQ